MQRSAHTASPKSPQISLLFFSSPEEAFVPAIFGLISRERRSLPKKLKIFLGSFFHSSISGPLPARIWLRDRVALPDRHLGTGLPGGRRPHADRVAIAAAAAAAELCAATTTAAAAADQGRVGSWIAAGQGCQGAGPGGCGELRGERKSGTFQSPDRYLKLQLMWY